LSPFQTGAAVRIVGGNIFTEEDRRYDEDLEVERLEDDIFKEAVEEYEEL
jgi:hypothetical protein